ncbi:nuclear transport factor 2 family protein [Ekhidna sp. To15]|uniref:nuclear transport factor 2 family protein n=1 Tax=Ekhidna sp. To15 TaxID=3395267 RepID=UPI003F51D47D
MRIILSILALSFFTVLNAQDKEVEAIKGQVKKFSNYLMTDQRAEVVKMYTDDAKIFPEGTDILEDDGLSNYWNPKNRSWKTTYHKITPVEIKVIGNEAYDYGYYEGTSTNDDRTSNWKGKYVIIWRKVEREWKIYLDIWNSIKG